MYLVKIYGPDPQAGPDALLEEADFTSGFDAMRYIAGEEGTGRRAELFAEHPPSEWVTVWTAERRGRAGREDCLARFERRYRGEVAVADSRVLWPAEVTEYPSLQLKASAAPYVSPFRLEAIPDLPGAVRRVPRNSG